MIAEFYGQLLARRALNTGAGWQSEIERQRQFAIERHQAEIERDHGLARGQINGLSDYYRPGIACIPQVEDYNGISKEPKTYREELQAEIDNWLM